MKYAQNTTVSSQRSKAEIEEILTKYGADQFVSGWQDNKAMIGFRMKNRLVKFVLPLPTKDRKDFWFTEHQRKKRTPEQAHVLWEQATRQSWRALLLVVKAKLEAVESGITSFEEEFLAHIVLPNGQTIGQWIQPQIQNVYETKELPALLSGY